MSPKLVGGARRDCRSDQSQLPYDHGHVCANRPKSTSACPSSFPAARPERTGQGDVATTRTGPTPSTHAELGQPCFRGMGHHCVSTLPPSPPDLIDIELRRDSTTAQSSRSAANATAPSLASCLEQVPRRRHPVHHLVIDLTATTFIDLGALRRLLDTHKRPVAPEPPAPWPGAGPPCCASCRSSRPRRSSLLPAQHPEGGRAVPTTTSSTAHTDLPSANSVTPHRADRSDTNCNPRPRRDRRSVRRGRGGWHR